MQRKKKELKLNPAQLRAASIIPKMVVNIWSRATGKSFLIGWYMHLFVRWMPRALVGIVGRTYKEMLTNTMQSTMDALERLGYVEGVHYWARQRPPKTATYWKGPYNRVYEWGYAFTFYNGTTFLLMSQDRQGGNRGASLDGVICDEGLNLDLGKFEKEIPAANRGNKDRFRGIPFHHGVFIQSSMPWTNESQWLLEYGQYYEEDGTNTKQLKQDLCELQLDYIDAPDAATRRAILPRVVELMKQVEHYPSPEGVFYHEATVFDNLHNLGLDYLHSLRRTIPTESSFLIEVLNKRFDRLEDGFYPEFDERRHVYRDSYTYHQLDDVGFDFKKVEESIDSRMDADCHRADPLIISTDWGASFNCMVVAQERNNELIILKNIYVRHQMFDEVFKAFCHYYRHHHNRRVDFYYDRNGNSKRAGASETMADEAARVMRRNNWNVVPQSRGLDPYHFAKFNLINQIMKEEQLGWPHLRINGNNCKELIQSISRAGVYESEGKLKKDKRPERNRNLDQAHTTHLSDALDIMVYERYEHLVDSSPSSGLLIT